MHWVQLRIIYEQQKGILKLGEKGIEMAAKLLHSFGDDNADLQRQIGCMTGIFQLFDRQQIITTRRIGGSNTKRLPSGISRTYGVNFELDSKSKYHRPMPKEKNSTKYACEQQQISIESSRPSFSSSSRSSSFSSLDCNFKVNQPDPSPYGRIIFPETPSRDPSMSQPGTSPQYSRSSLDLRDVVKDSIHRDTLDSSMKLNNSLRQTLPSNLKYREVPWYCDESVEHSRVSSVSNDFRRFSYDGRETIPSAPKNKEFPWLSLDSSEGSTRSFNSDLKPAGPSVVAKLMGLETLADADVATKNNLKSPINTSSCDEREPFSRPISNSTRNLWMEPVSPHGRNADVVMKPVSSSRFPIEPAPWKHPDGAHRSQKPAFRNVRTHPRPNDATIPNVYSEIEKRLKDLEFTQSGKDLRALKQILEAMQDKGLLGSSTRREGLDGNFAILREQHPTFSKSEINAQLVNKGAFESPIVIMKPAKLVPKSGIPFSSMIPMDRFSNSHNPRVNESLNNRTSKQQVPKIRVKENGNPRPLKSGQSSLCSPNSLKENASNSTKTSTSVSPRLQQRKLELEKRSRPPISPDSNKTKKLIVKNQPESSSPGRKRRPKIVKKPQNDDQSSVSSESKSLCYQDDGLEVTSLEQLSESSSSKSPSLKAAKYAVSGIGQQKFVPKMTEGDLGGLGSVASEQPSPVSVLDNKMYADEASSPVRRVSDVLKDEAIIKDNLNRKEQNKHEEFIPNTTINRKKLENIENLVKKLRRVNSTHDEAHTDYIASLCENQNPDHRYISEILLASGLLLRDLNLSLSIFQLHPSGYPINPELFLVLEQTKASTLEKEQSGFGNIVRVKCDKEKFHRKLIFDAVNEILAKKITSMGNTSKKLARRSLGAQKLLRDLCSEIESLQMKKPSFILKDDEDSLRSILCEDVMNRSESWKDFNGDLSGLVLDIERLVFRDLISEIVRGEAVGIKAERRCRQLFT